MAITVSDIDEMVARFGNKIVNAQANLEAPIRSILTEVNEPGRVGIVNVKAGGFSSTGWVADQGTLPSGEDVQPTQATYLPKFLFSRISIPRGAATLAAGEGEGINIVYEQMESCGRDLGRSLDFSAVQASAFLTLSLAQAGEFTASATSATDDTFTVSDPSPFRIGMTLQRYQGGALEEHMVVSGVTIDHDGSSHTVDVDRVQHSVALVGDPAANDVLYLRGAKDDGMVSLDDIADESGTLYSLAVTQRDWKGNEQASTGTLTVDKMRDLSVSIKRRRGRGPDCLLMNALNERRYTDQLLGARRFGGGSAMDAVGGSSSTFEGMPIHLDENVADGNIYYLTKEDVKLHVFKDFGDDMDGGPVGAQTGGGLRHVNISDANFEYDVQRWGAFNLRCTRRNGTGQLSGITA